MPWDEAMTAYEGYIPLAALRELSPGAVVMMEVQYDGTIRREPQRRRKRRSREPERYQRLPAGATKIRQWLTWYEHGASAGWLARQLARQRGGVGRFFEHGGNGGLSDRGEDELEAALKFRIYVIGEMGEPGAWPESR